MELNDPSIMMANESSGVGSEVDGVVKTVTNDEIDNFFQSIKNRQEVGGIDEPKPQSRKSKVLANLKSKSVGKVALFSTDYKPEVSSKEFVYSINEILEIKSSIPEAFYEEVSIMLPKKKFWRLTGRFVENGSGANGPHGKGAQRHHKNGAQGPNGKVPSSENGQFARRNSKSKIRGTNLKKNGKFGKSERFIEENDIKVNNDDLIELEAEFDMTGNSMADFEAWKMKMKELENKKKGIAPTAPIEAEKKPLSQTTSSSISDFLKLNSKTSDSIDPKQGLPSDSRFEPSNLEPAGKYNLNKQSELPETITGGSSRFSSFFTASPSSVSLPEKASESSTHPSEAKEPSSMRPLAGNGSRMMSFFKTAKSTNASEQSVEGNDQARSQPPISNQQQHLSSQIDPRLTQHNAQNVPNQHSMQQQPNQQNLQSNSNPAKNMQQNSLPQRMAHQMPSQQMAPPPGVHPIQLQQMGMSTDMFFQGLLNKGKGSEQNMMQPGVMLPQGGRQQPMPMGLNQNFPNGMPPPHMMPRGGFPPFQGQPIPMPPNGNGPARNSEHSDQSQNRSIPQPMMMNGAPPGFPPMQGLPPNMMFPQNGMMPMGKQEMYQPMRPSVQGKDGISDFPAQSGLPMNGKR